MKHLHAAIHCVYWDSDSQRSQRSDIPSAEGTESLMPYLSCAMLTSGAISHPLSPTESAAGWAGPPLAATSAAASSVRYAVSCSSRSTKKCRLKEKRWRSQFKFVKNKYRAVAS